jgi:hypothetical protein
VSEITVSVDKIEALREDVTEFRQDVKELRHAVNALVVNQSENKFLKEHIERVELLLTGGFDKLNQTLSSQQTQINEINRTVFLHSKIWMGIVIAVGMLMAPSLGLLGWNYSQMEALKDRQVLQNTRLQLIEQKLELDPRDRPVHK